MAQTYYKVTKGGRSVNNQIRRQYPLNKWVVAKPVSKGVWNVNINTPSKLFIFKKYEDALNFASKFWNQVSIWKCIVKNPKKLMYRARMGLGSDIYSFWKAYNNKKRVQGKFFTSYTPKGTYCCDAIKLIKLVERIKND